MPALNDPEGAHVPDGARVIDAHVHLFPDRVATAIWAWFDAHGWPIRYKLSADTIVQFLATRGVSQIVGLVYAHKPGMAESLNAFIAGLADRYPSVIPCGTVLPGEPDTRAIVARAFNRYGLAGIKIHCHVQCVAPDDPRLDPVYEEAAAALRPVVIHAGREPASDAYRCDPHALCSAAAVRRALERHPSLTLVVPHLGADEFDAFDTLLDDFPRLMLDTTMMLANYFPVAPPADLLHRRADRLIYGTDFPNIPYAWDRELRHIVAANLSPDARDAILYKNTLRVFSRSS
ncbi:MAG: amidohydrolase [Deltaproteobacteria bacterium]|nr:amidohydrolase [Deltaproteobacteria bacterium]